MVAGDLQGGSPWEATEDEGYWDSLMRQGEIASATTSHGERMEQRNGADAAAFPRPFSDDIANRANSAAREQDWQTAQQAFADGSVFDLPVIGYNRGGLLAQYGQLQAFVPASHLVGLPRLPDPDERCRALEGKIGGTLELKVIEIDRERGRLIMSERAAIDSRRGDVLTQLQPGDVRSGRVTNLRPFGAFVDLGGVEGLIHVSELAWTRVGHPADVLNVGDEVQVYVMSVAPEKRRIALSIKRLNPDPWSLLDEHYAVGQVVRCVVTNVVSFGAFARVEEGVEGLVHISELAEGNFLHPRNVVQEGDEIQARILSMDPANHRLALSLRQVRTASSLKQTAEADYQFVDLPGEEPAAQSV